MGDDGFGPAVVQAFDAQYVATPDVEVVDLGTPGLDLTPWLADAQHVILVDTVKADLPPGTLRLYDKRDLVRHPPFARVSPHDPGVKETILTLEFAGRAPHELTLIGVVPASSDMGTELSAPVAASVSRAVQAVVAALERIGCRVQRRIEPPVPLVRHRPWWSDRVAG
jgi:hydrogenase maturation protease